MTHDARILQERVRALEDVVVGAADADMPDTHTNPARFQFRLVDVDDRQLARFGAGYGAHGILRSRTLSPAARKASSVVDDDLDEVAGGVTYLHPFADLTKGIALRVKTRPNVIEGARVRQDDSEP